MKYFRRLNNYTDHKYLCYNCFKPCAQWEMLNGWDSDSKVPLRFATVCSKPCIHAILVKGIEEGIRDRKQLKSWETAFAYYKMVVKRLKYLLKVMDEYEKDIDSEFFELAQIERGNPLPYTGP